MSEYPKILIGDCRETLAQIAEESVHCCVTSPPYWGLRDYGTGQDGIGLEDTVEQHLTNMVIVFEEVHRVLRSDGTLWLNYGDRYGGIAKQNAKNLCGLPWRVAFALQGAGWILRSDIIWAKPNPMPESVNDRPTCSHEYLFLFSKSPKYFYDQDAVREDSDQPGRIRNDTIGGKSWKERQQHDRGGVVSGAMSRNRRTVWTIATQPTPEAHFATFPERLIEPCILAGTSERGACSKCGAPWVREVERSTASGVRGEHERNHARSQRHGHEDRNFEHNYVPTVATVGWQPSCKCSAVTVPCIVLDPFFGSGTVGRVAEKHGRHWIGCELNEEYIKIAKKRTAQMSLLTRCH